MKIKLAGRIIIILVSFFSVYIVSRSIGWLALEDSFKRATIGDDVQERYGKEKDRNSLRVAIYPGAGFAGGLVYNNGLQAGEKSLFFEKHKLLVDFKIEEDIERCLELLRDDEADIIWSTPEILSFFYRKHSDLNLAAFMQYSWSRGEDLILGDESKSHLDFKGKTITCSRGSSAHFFALFLLQQKGLDPESVHWKLTDTEHDSVLSFIKGKAEICALKSSSMPLLKSSNKNYRIIISTEDATNLISGIFVTRESFIVLHKDLLEKFAMGWFEGVSLLGENPGKAAGIISENFKISMDEAMGMLRNVDITGYQENKVFFDITSRKETDVGFNELFDISLSCWRTSHRGCGHLSPNIFKNNSILIGISKKISSKLRLGQYKSPGLGGANSGRENFYLTRPLPVNFSINSSEIEPSAENSLEDVLLLSSIFGTSDIYLTGFVSADETGGDYLKNTRIYNVMNFFTYRYRLQGGRVKIVNDLPITSDSKADKKRGVMVTLVSKGGA